MKFEMQRGILVPILPKRPHRAVAQIKPKALDHDELIRTGQRIRADQCARDRRAELLRPKRRAFVDKGPAPLHAQTDYWGRLVGTGAEAMDQQYHGGADPDGEDAAEWYEFGGGEIETRRARRRISSRTG